MIYNILVYFILYRDKKLCSGQNITFKELNIIHYFSQYNHALFHQPIQKI